MRTEEEWAEETKRLLRAEMTRRGVTYDQLAEKLAAIGIIDSVDRQSVRIPPPVSGDEDEVLSQTTNVGSPSRGNTATSYPFIDQ